MKKKICLIASSGGHYEQIIMLKKLEDYFDVYYVTEKTFYSNKNDNVYYINQINRREKFFIVKFIRIFFQSLRIFFIERPDIIISTGAMSVIPTFLIGRLCKKKLIFIESFAKLNSSTMTGRFVYKLSDHIVVQWESMLTVYPEAQYFGSIY
ncbi:PssD/Cps14F family polysaccharide biosynthesis glycosyltransferase [Enterococcus sp. AZ196]|uniref:PssD/Cps14F family polysaccharide biosynthesis glycosyltransferase n=1 Tax=Enterococcus sp. AZ196 TaxID=2774659 RepID=UPI003D2BBD74